MKKIDTPAGCHVDAIKHSGIVKQTDEAFYYISIVAQSACDACHSKAMCNIGAIKEEIIEVPRGENTGLTVGDKVEVMMEKTLGTRAVMLGYFYPFLLLITSLIITTSTMKSEGAAALISIAILIPYYLILYIRRNHLKKTFSFRIS